MTKAEEELPNLVCNYQSVSERQKQRKENVCYQEIEERRQIISRAGKVFFSMKIF